jgi:adenosylcobinamide-phosphate synthase
MKPLLRSAGAAAAGLALDHWLGEPPIEPHPVAVFGRAMSAVERVAWHNDRAAGVRYTVAGVGAAVVGGVRLAGLGGGRVAWVRSQVAAVVATWVTVAGKGLSEAALEVAGPLGRGDLESARQALPALVGRDPRDLDVSEIARAVVESVAENTVDAVVAPALWAAFGGAAGTLGYRAVNTLDSMVGHHSPRYEHFGWASARLDDVANWVPARVTAVLVAVVRPRRAVAIARAVRRDAPGHPSPNAGVAEAAFAAALGLQLGGTNTYGARVEVRPPLGSGRPAAPDDIAAAIRLADHVALALAVGLVAFPLGRRAAGGVAARAAARTARRRPRASSEGQPVEEHPAGKQQPAGQAG